MSYSTPVKASVSAIRNKHFSAQERAYRGHKSRGTLWFYLHDHGDEVRKWNRKRDECMNCKEKQSQKGILLAKMSSQLSRPGRQFDLDPDHLEGTSKSFLQQVSSKFSDQDKRGPPCSQVDERDNRVYWTVWI